MIRFYVDTEKDAQRCRQALQSQIPITVPGPTERGEKRIFTGMIWAVEEPADSNPQKGWRVTMFS
jgi:hypothetical protein